MAENYFGITDTGKLRDNNEDTFIAETFLSDQLIAACVIDGVGGYAGGEIAAGLAKDAILDRLGNPQDNLIPMMTEAFAAANEIIHYEKLRNAKNGHMACVLTLAIADITNNKFYYAHLGDTRLYLFRDNTLVKVTHDHSFVGLLEDSGRLTEEAAMSHPKRNEINKALGFNTDFTISDIETGESPFLPGDIILLCSDGLSDMIDTSAIVSVLNANESLSQKAYQLIASANDAGGRDNITAVLVQNNKSPLKHTATKPVIAIKKNEELFTEDKAENADTEPEEPLLRAENKNTGSKTIAILSFLCLCLLTGFIWLLYQTYQNKQKRPDPQNITTRKKRNEQEQNFADSLKTAVNNKVLTIGISNEVIIITDSLVIQNDSLRINGNGVTLLRDSSYDGPAFILSDNCKYILLDSLIFENFNVGILLKKKALHLKNVQFKNCLIPVEYNLLFPANKFINGSFADSLLNNPGSLTE